MPRRLKIARFFLRNHQLQFQWLDGAGEEEAGYLANCVLLLRDELANEHLVSLRSPQKVRPAPIKLKSGNAFSTHTIPYMRCKCGEDHSQKDVKGYKYCKD